MSARLDLRGRRALVTGAGHRVGRSIALALAREGMQIGVHYHQSRDDALATLREIRALGADGELFQADLSNREAARDLVDRVLIAHGGLDLLVPSAASFEKIPLEAVDDEAWDRTLALNLSSPFALAQRAVPALRQSHGSIVFVTCASANRPFRGYAPYVVSKGALAHLMRTLALELAPEIRVNAVAPGVVLPPADTDADRLSALVRRVPLKRAGVADDVGDAVVYLARADYVTGQELAVDGGRNAIG